MAPIMQQRSQLTLNTYIYRRLSGREREEKKRGKREERREKREERRDKREETREKREERREKREERSLSVNFWNTI